MLFLNDSDTVLLRFVIMLLAEPDLGEEGTLAGGRQNLYYFLQNSLAYSKRSTK